MTTKAATTTAASTTNAVTTMWAGDEASFDVAAQAMDAIRQGLACGSIKALSDSEIEAQSSHLLQVSGNIGIISIKGALVNADSPYLRYFGVTGYNDIRRAATAAASDPTVKKIVLDVDSPGGAVAGLDDIATFLATIDKTVKPIHTYSGSLMASAGLWLGASGRTISIGATTIIGSLGVVMVHRENSKMQAEMGIKSTVIRAGKFKQAANSHEPLTEAAKAGIESMLEETYKVFLGHVSKSLGDDYAKADRTYGQGREFVGQQAVDVGLAKAITSFDKFISSLQSSVDKAPASQHNAGNNPRGIPMFKTLSAVQVEAMKAAGLSDDQIKAVDDKQVEANTAAEAAAAKAKADQEAKAAADAAIEAAKGGNGMTAMIDRIASQQATITKLEGELAASKAQVAPLQAGIDQCREIVASSLSTMRVAMSQANPDLKATSITDMLTQHAAIATDFKSKFPTGQVAALSSSADANKDLGAPAPWMRSAAAAQASRAAK